MTISSGFMQGKKRFANKQINNPTVFRYFIVLNNKSFIT